MKTFLSSLEMIELHPAEYEIFPFLYFPGIEAIVSLIKPNIFIK